MNFFCGPVISVVNEEIIHNDFGFQRSHHAIFINAELHVGKKHEKEKHWREKTRTFFMKIGLRRKKIDYFEAERNVEDLSSTIQRRMCILRISFIHYSEKNVYIANIPGNWQNALISRVVLFDKKGLKEALTLK